MEFFRDFDMLIMVENSIREFVMPYMGSLKPTTKNDHL